MDIEKRLEKIEESQRELLEITVRLDERTEALCKSLDPIENRILERCKSEVKAIGWRGVAGISIAIITGLSGLVLSLLRMHLF